MRHFLQHIILSSILLLAIPLMANNSCPERYVNYAFKLSLCKVGLGTISEGKDGATLVVTSESTVAEIFFEPISEKLSAEEVWKTQFAKELEKEGEGNLLQIKGGQFFIDSIPAYIGVTYMPTLEEGNPFKKRYYHITLCFVHANRAYYISSYCFGKNFNPNDVLVKDIARQAKLLFPEKAGLSASEKKKLDSFGNSLFSSLKDNKAKQFTPLFYSNPQLANAIEKQVQDEKIRKRLLQNIESESTYTDKEVEKLKKALFKSIIKEAKSIGIKWKDAKFISFEYEYFKENPDLKTGAAIIRFSSNNNLYQLKITEIHLIQANWLAKSSIELIKE